MGGQWTWTGNGMDDKWSTTNNWIPATGYPTNQPTAAQDLVFSGSARLTPDQDLADPYYFHSMVFSNDVGAFVLGGTTNVTGTNGWRSYQLASSAPVVTVLGANNISIKGALITRTTGDSNSITVPANVVLQVPWIAGGSGRTVVKNGAGLLRVYEDADGQCYPLVHATVGPLWQVNDGTVEIGTRTNRYVYGNGNGTNWVLDSSQNKSFYGMTVGDGVGAATSAVMRAIVTGGFTSINNYNGATVNSDGWWDFQYNGIDFNSGALNINGGRFSFGRHPVNGAPSYSCYFKNNSKIVMAGGTFEEYTNTTSGILWYPGAEIIATNPAASTAVVDGRFTVSTGVNPPYLFTIYDAPGLSVEMRVKQVIGGGADLVKREAGTLQLEGNNTYTGTTTNQAGTLLINGTTSGQGDYAILSGATLGGTGTVGQAVGKSVTVNGGAIAPGTTNVGVLTIQRDVTFNASSGLKIDVASGGAVAGVDFDQLKVLGNVTGLANVGLTVTVLGSPKFNGTPMTILDAGNSLAGAVLNSTTFVNGGKYTLVVETGTGDLVIRLKPPPDGTVILFK